MKRYDMAMEEDDMRQLTYLRGQWVEFLDSEGLITENKRLRNALEKGIIFIKGIEIFVKSRQKINKPTGENWFDEKLAELKEALKDSE